MKYSLLVFILLEVVICFSQTPSQLTQVQETTDSPYKKICFMYVHRKRWPKPDDWFKSTGFFIAPNIILTAAHNIHNEKGTKVDEIRIFPAKNNGVYSYDSLIITGERNCENAIVTHPNYSFLKRIKKRIKWDFGIVVLPDATIRANPKITSDTCFYLDPTYQLHVNDTLNVAGYPADPSAGYNGDFMTYQYDLCRDIDDKTISHQLDTYRGNSGSPIWVNVNKKHIVVAIHTFGEAGTYLDQENLQTLLSWINSH